MHDWVEKEWACPEKKFRYDRGSSCEPLHGSSASSSGFGITLLNPGIIDDANGHGTGHQNEHRFGWFWSKHVFFAGFSHA